jgi:hypothetical protein
MTGSSGPRLAGGGSGGVGVGEQVDGTPQPLGWLGKGEAEPVVEGVTGAEPGAGRQAQPMAFGHGGPGPGPREGPGEPLALPLVQQQAGGVLEVGHDVGRRRACLAEHALHPVQPLVGALEVDGDRKDAPAQDPRRVERAGIGGVLDEQPVPSPR